MLRTLVVLAVLVTLTACPNWTGAHKYAAQDEARDYAAEMGYEVSHSSCVRQDTDGDGYVSCTLKLMNSQIVNVECAGAWNLNTGCREPKLAVGQLHN